MGLDKLRCKQSVIVSRRAYPSGPVYPRCYYVEPKEISTFDFENVRSSWALIIQNTSSEYQKHQSTLDSGSAAAWFYDSFYAQLFRVASNVRPLFKNDMKVQGRALVKMISTALSVLDYEPSLVPALEQLAILHTKKGVTCPQLLVTYLCGR